MTSIAKRLRLTALTALAAGVLVTPALAANGDNVGDTQMCIDTQYIYDTPVIDSETILVRMDGPKRGYKRIDLAHRCPGLHKGAGFSYTTTLNKLCKQDGLKALNNTGASCMIHQIVTIDEAEADELMAR